MWLGSHRSILFALFASRAVAAPSQELIKRDPHPGRYNADFSPACEWSLDGFWYGNNFLPDPNCIRSIAPYDRHGRITIHTVPAITDDYTTYPPRTYTDVIRAGKPQTVTRRITKTILGTDSELKTLTLMSSSLLRTRVSLQTNFFYRIDDYEWPPPLTHNTWPKSKDVTTIPGLVWPVPEPSSQPELLEPVAVVKGRKKKQHKQKISSVAPEVDAGPGVTSYPGQVGLETALDDAVPTATYAAVQTPAPQAVAASEAFVDEHRIVSPDEAVQTEPVYVYDEDASDIKVKRDALLGFDPILSYEYEGGVIGNHALANPVTPEAQVDDLHDPVETSTSRSTAAALTSTVIRNVPTSLIPGVQIPAATKRMATVEELPQSDAKIATARRTSTTTLREAVTNIIPAQLSAERGNIASQKKRTTTVIEELPGSNAVAGTTKLSTIDTLTETHTRIVPSQSALTHRTTTTTVPGDTAIDAVSAVAGTTNASQPTESVVTDIRPMIDDANSSSTADIPEPTDGVVDDAEDVVEEVFFTVTVTASEPQPTDGAANLIARHIKRSDDSDTSSSSSSSEEDTSDSGPPTASDSDSSSDSDNEGIEVLTAVHLHHSEIRNADSGDGKLQYQEILKHEKPVDAYAAPPFASGAQPAQGPPPPVIQGGIVLGAPVPKGIAVNLVTSVRKPQDNGKAVGPATALRIAPAPSFRHTRSVTATRKVSHPSIAVIGAQVKAPTTHAAKPTVTQIKNAKEDEFSTYEQDGQKAQAVGSPSASAKRDRNIASKAVIDKLEKESHSTAAPVIAGKDSMKAKSTDTEKNSVVEKLHGSSKQDREISIPSVATLVAVEKDAIPSKNNEKITALQKIIDPDAAEKLVKKVKFTTEIDDGLKVAMPLAGVPIADESYRFTDEVDNGVKVPMPLINRVIVPAINDDNKTKYSGAAEVEVKVSKPIPALADEDVKAAIPVISDKVAPIVSIDKPPVIANGVNTPALVEESRKKVSFAPIVDVLGAAEPSTVALKEEHNFETGRGSFLKFIPSATSETTRASKTVSIASKKGSNPTAVEDVEDDMEDTDENNDEDTDGEETIEADVSRKGDAQAWSSKGSVSTGIGTDKTADKPEAKFAEKNEKTGSSDKVDETDDMIDEEEEKEEEEEEEEVSEAVVEPTPTTATTTTKKPIWGLPPKISSLRFPADALPPSSTFVVQTEYPKEELPETTYYPKIRPAYGNGLYMPDITLPTLEAPVPITYSTPLPETTTVLSYPSDAEIPRTVVLSRISDNANPRPDSFFTSTKKAALPAAAVPATVTDASLYSTPTGIGTVEIIASAPTLTSVISSTRRSRKAPNYGHTTTDFSTFTLSWTQSPYGNTRTRRPRRKTTTNALGSLTTITEAVPTHSATQYRLPDYIPIIPEPSQAAPEKIDTGYDDDYPADYDDSLDYSQSTTIRTLIDPLPYGAQARGIWPPVWPTTVTAYMIQTITICAFKPEDVCRVVYVDEGCRQVGLLGGENDETSAQGMCLMDMGWVALKPRLSANRWVRGITVPLKLA